MGLLTAIADFKQANRETWAAGDSVALAESVDGAPPADLLARVPIAPREDVLDVGTGTGNIAIRAALAGADVVGLDLSPELLDVARPRGYLAGVHVDWIEGDAEALPFADASFDVVLSAFGAQFAPRHDVVAAELARVCRPCGRIGLVNWTPGGCIGRLYGILGHHLPWDSAYASPALWGHERHLAALFLGTGIEWRFARGRNPWRFGSAEEWVSFMEDNDGPTVIARERLIADGRWDACRAELVDLAHEYDEARDGSLLLRAEYLIAVGVKAG
jgi:SAM-dependent methyltransferase